MLSAFSPGGTAMFYMPWPASPSSGLEKDAMTEALIDFERRYAYALGYLLGPAGEWIAQEPMGRPGVTCRQE